MALEPKVRTAMQKLDTLLARAVAAFKAELGDQLHACYVYGSAVRGNAIEGVSDVNLLLVLNESNSGTQQAVARALKDFPEVDPFVLGRNGFERSARAFAPKFASIRRNCRLLHGVDILATIKVDAALERFLSEQALRNLRLRLAFSFMTRQRHKSYDRFVLRNLSALFVQISEVLRLEGHVIPADFAARIPVFESTFQLEGAVLHELLAAKRQPRRLTDAELVGIHERLFPVLEKVMQWIEQRWVA